MRKHQRQTRDIDTWLSIKPFRDKSHHLFA
jgi:hypothetical protein